MGVERGCMKFFGVPFEIWCVFLMHFKGIFKTFFQMDLCKWSGFAFLVDI